MAQGVLDLQPGAMTFFIYSPLTPTVDLWPPNDSRRCVPRPPLSDLANHRNHYVGPAKSTWPNIHHGLIPDWNFMKITDFTTWVEPNGLRNSSIFILFQKANNLWTIYKTIILQFTQGFPLFWAPWISLWPRFSPLRFQKKTKKTPLRKHLHFRKHQYYQGNINNSTSQNHN